MTLHSAGADLVVGVGGVGTGVLYELVGDHTLGREESRAVRPVDQQDRCKLQIIAHYVRRFTPRDVAVIPVCRVGDDADGRLVQAELAAEGMDLRAVRVDRDRRTLTSVCFIYPDGDGGNLTVADSASDAVTEADLDPVLPLLTRHGARGIVLAAPEVPLPARAALLAAGTAAGSIRFASFLSGEMPEVVRLGLLDQVDVLSINIDEAAALLGGPPVAAASIVQDAAALLRARHPRLRFCITAGRRGSWTWDGSSLQHVPVRAVTAVNTAGAGDAHIAGLIVGAVHGLDLHAAARLAAAISAHSVTSVDTIDSGLDAAALARFVEEDDPDLARWLTAADLVSSAG
ncbi:carbohydrate kinase family protein [Amnibacterium kyonggiense]|uniref:Sugar/nucleoside kinase (Ribokinase family) n=1 Tax=Amnibacterium kyonggiense TaxID=595671 RepID=A0A4R7FKE7_9MICO|nr:carbohydrate kinase family protein [Amnibacterium kyonggiense]TDS76818.1 sugar/nucleoside kinase (ribokinase family) [Amnibacterium kyonggiense]